MLPSSARGDPERLNDQANVKEQAGLPDVQKVVTKLSMTRKVASRVHLRDASQARAHAMTCIVSADRAQRHHDPVNGGIGLAWAERPRAHNAHVAAENIPELRQLIERRRAKNPADPC